MLLCLAALSFLLDAGAVVAQSDDEPVAYQTTYQKCSKLPKHPCGFCRCMDDKNYLKEDKFYCDCRYLLPQRDCKKFRDQGYQLNGVYNVNSQSDKVVSVYCDMNTDGGGWTVIQRRVDGKTDFFRNWDHYKNGFGDLHYNMWAGNEIIHAVTKQGTRSDLRIELTDFDKEKRFAEYERFNVANETLNYAMQMGRYDGDAGESGEGMFFHSGAPFSTYDRDNDGFESINCAKAKQSGWWYTKCAKVHLNGRYYLHNKNVARGKGIFWTPFNGRDTSLKFVEMKVRRTVKRDMREV